MTKQHDGSSSQDKNEMTITSQQEDKQENGSTEKKSHKSHQNKQSTVSSKMQILSPFDGLSVSEEKTLVRRLSFILISLTLAVLVTLYIISPLSKLDRIVLSGLEHGSPEEVIATSDLQTGKSLWPQYFDRQAEMSRIVKKNKRIKSADLKLKKLNQFYVTITEYQTVAIVKNKETSYPVLENGKVVEEAVRESDNKYPVLLNFEEGESLDAFLKAYQTFSPDLKGKIIDIESLATKTNPFRVKFKMKDGNEVIGLSPTIADKMVFYDKIAREMKENGVIDMEAGASGIYSYPFKKDEKTDETQDTAEDTDINDTITGDETNEVDGIAEEWNE
ncbi:cell division protein FtsQ/DivIB [Vagococcus jeotgali]|uniref:cell division protein FtsQ/DivIB n=1 Tax=Vagococcus jeotgali TaxID=3109030 RepID=UPI002DDA41EA|nr:cell division protein FtsQ/DivIB [Vagococcus sp. B2T-5]